MLADYEFKTNPDVKLYGPPLVARLPTLVDLDDIARQIGVIPRYETC